MRHIGTYLILLGIVFLGDRLGGFVLKNLGDSSQFRYSRLYAGKADADLLFIGNSRGLGFYEPYITAISGQKTCNLSYNSLPGDAANVLVSDYIDQYPSVKTLIVDVTMLDRENDALLNGFLAYLHKSKRFDDLIRTKIPSAWYGAQVTHLFRYNHEIFQRVLYYQNRSDQDWLLDRVITEATIAKADTFQFNIKTNAYLLDQFREMLTYAKSKGVTVHLVAGPYFPSFNVGGLDTFIQQIEAVSGQKVHNYAKAISDPSDFGDLQHINQKGSKKYIQLLQEDGILP